MILPRVRDQLKAPLRNLAPFRAMTTGEMLEQVALERRSNSFALESLRLLFRSRRLPRDITMLICEMAYVGWFVEHLTQAQYFESIEADDDET
jgi:hypothetical protein